MQRMDIADLFSRVRAAIEDETSITTEEREELIDDLVTAELEHRVDLDKGPANV